MAFVPAGGHRLEVVEIDAGGRDRPTLVLLHEGLGSIAMWRDFPHRLAHATASRVVAYSRRGYGNSDPLTGARGVRYMHDEADIVLPELLDALGIAAAREAYGTTALRAKLARYHADVDGAFRGWNDIWLHPDFRAWNIEACLPRIACPILAIQGEDDEYGTMAQLDRIARGARDVELVKLGDCRHSPHRDQPDAVLDAIGRFVDRVRAP